MKFLAILLTSLFLLPLFFNISLEKKPVYNNVELFDPSLAKINSIQNLIHYADSSAARDHIKNGSLGYAVLVSCIIRKRFYHGFSSYTLQQNWVAAIAQYCFGLSLASPVNPNEILQYPYAGCSQQAIVLMETMKQKNISYRSVGFPHHYATELNFKNTWYFFDPNMEPEIKVKERNHNKWKGSADNLKKYYNGNCTYLDWTFGKSIPAIFGIPNAAPAPRANIFQSVTKFLSKILWIFPLIFFVYPRPNNAK
jgi:hypothetical protein